MKQTEKLGRWWSVVPFVVFLLLSVYFYGPSRASMPSTSDTVVYEIVPREDSLTEWELFTLALIGVESTFDSTALSDKDARGFLQLTSVWVDEVNRLCGTSYRYEDAWRTESAVELYERMQDHKNPGRDLETAIRLHNPRAGRWYARRIYREMEKVRAYEKVRKVLIER